MKRQATDPPDELDASETAALWAWCESHGYSREQMDYAVEFVFDWALSNGKQKRSWLATIRNAMRAGWALPPTGGGHGNGSVVESWADKERAALVAAMEARKR